MASKRKSTTPCMIPNKTMHLREELEQDAYLSDPPSLRQAQARDQGYPMGGNRQSPLERSPGESSRPEGGGIVKDWGGTYMCRHCNFETQDLNLFLDHVYSGHPDFRADPSFQCVDCGVSAAKFEGLALHNARVHLSTVSTTLQLRKRDMRLVVEQSLVTGTETARDTEISITKTPIMRMLKGKSESKRIVVSHSSHDEPSSDPPPLFISTSKDTERKETPTVTVTHVPTIMHNGTATKVTLPSAIQIVNGSGALPMLKTAITQVVSVIQNRNFHHQTAPITVSSALSSTTSYSTSSKNMPKVMIPLSSIPTYSASMDSSSFLKTSFSKFPYPTKAELCYLTVVTKFPEEQIKIWFTAQRLKQGISWSPEEIEEARRKMFNTIIQTAPPSTQHHTLHRGQTQAQHTITVLPASLGSTGIPHILQGSLVGQGGVIVTQPMMANGIQVSNAPMALAAASSPSTKHFSSSSPAPSGSTDASGTPISRTLPNTFLDPSFYKSKKSVEQLCALKESFTNNQFPNQEEVDRLISITGLTVREVRKWFSDRRYHFRNLKGGRSSTGSQGGASTPTTPGLASATTRSGTPSGTPMDLSDTATPNEPPPKKQQGSAALSAPPSQMPTSPTTLSRRPPRPPSPDFTAIRYKERDPQQVRALEASFSQDPDPSGEEVDRLRSETKMTRREIHGWFAERRKRVAAEKKKEELEREEEEEMDAGGREVGGKSKDDAGVKKEEDAEERQKEDGSGSELKVNPIKINLKMLKVTESNGKLETEGGQANSPTMPTLFPPAPTLTPAPSTIPSLTPKPSPSPKPSPIRGKKTLEQLHLLKQVFARTQWPSAVQYDELISSTGLPRPEVVRWFGDCRYVQKNSQLKWLEAYQTMVLEEDFQRGDTQMLKAHLEAHGKCLSMVLELAQASGLTEELVRRWFSTQAPLLLQGKDRGVAEEVEAGETPGVGGVTVTASPAPTAPMEGGAAEPVQGEGEVKEEKMEQSVCGGTKEGDEERSAENKAVNPGKVPDLSEGIM
ncbi:unnamed protein product [Coregonus sp. 'balchen']|nr:unnamed protein product [Coregonus sp. 'balchen']